MELGTVEVRKKWIKSWKTMLGYQIVNGIVLLTVGVLFSWEGEGEDAALGVIRSLWAMFWLVLCRKCAYENHGTKFLKFFLFISGLGLLRGFSELIKMNFDLCYLIDYAVFISIFIWFANKSSELLNLNKKISQKIKKMECETINSVDIK